MFLDSLINQELTKILKYCSQWYSDNWGQFVKSMHKDNRIVHIEKKMVVDRSKKYGLRSNDWSYVTFVDSDDWVEHYVEILYKNNEYIRLLLEIIILLMNLRGCTTSIYLRFLLWESLWQCFHLWKTVWVQEMKSFAWYLFGENPFGSRFG